MRKNHLGSLLVAINNQINTESRKFSLSSGLTPSPMKLSQNQLDYREKLNKKIKGRALRVYSRLEKKDPFCQEGYYPPVSESFFK